jgi:ribosomal 30S subunit maturation factor RimM
VVGEITEVMEGPAVDLWVVKGPHGEVIFPAIKDVVVSVDLKSGVVISSSIDEFGG